MHDADISAIIDLSWFDDSVAARISLRSACFLLYRRPTWWTTMLVPFASTREVVAGSTLSWVWPVCWRLVVGMRLIRATAPTTVVEAFWEIQHTASDKSDW